MCSNTIVILLVEVRRNRQKNNIVRSNKSLRADIVCESFGCILQTDQSTVPAIQHVVCKTIQYIYLNKDFMF